MRRLHTSSLRQEARMLCAGEHIYLSGTVYTARDAAHRRLCEFLAQGQPLPFVLADACIYYAGPTPTPPGRIIGSCGPTTSSRMDIYTPRLFEQGVVATIGKGERSDAVAAGLQAHGAVYFCAPGGCGALAAKCVTSCAEIAFADLGCESIKRLTIKDFLLIVAMDCQGGNLFAQKGGTHVT